MLRMFITTDSSTKKVIAEDLLTLPDDIGNDAEKIREAFKQRLNGLARNRTLLRVFSMPYQKVPGSEERSVPVLGQETGGMYSFYYRRGYRVSFNGLIQRYRFGYSIHTQGGEMKLLVEAPAESTISSTQLPDEVFFSYFKELKKFLRKKKLKLGRPFKSEKTRNTWWAEPFLIIVDAQQKIILLTDTKCPWERGENAE